jgi:hypothetical protein
MSAFLCLSFFSPVWADGWGNTNWGMDASQVEKATMGKLIMNPTKSSFSHKLQDNISIGKYDFEVYLNFTNSKLDKVFIELVVTAMDSVSSYGYLMDELKKKYGPPSVGPIETKIPGGQTNKTEWVTKDTVIKLMCLIHRLVKNNVSVSVHYSPRQSEASGKL